MLNVVESIEQVGLALELAALFLLAARFLFREEQNSHFQSHLHWALYLQRSSFHEALVHSGRARHFLYWNVTSRKWRKWFMETGQIITVTGERHVRLCYY